MKQAFLPNTSPNASFHSDLRIALVFDYLRICFLSHLFDIIDNMRLALDTDVLVSGLRSATGASHRLLELLDEERIEAVANVSMMLEYEAVLKRTENLLAAALSVHDIDDFLNSFAMFVIPAPSFFLWRPMLRDPADEHVLEAAINGQAEAIVTFNVRHFALATSRFGIALLRPGEVLRRLEE